ncbi:MAG: N-acetylglucosaminyl-diphospho-decaprenol L-rhamnosyltransferase [Humibacillus sp.]|nr:N-acetylglucosaminyl-diphospho-decaprenol L-rhamnosyltransferase [Humibacillus sp.]
MGESASGGPADIATVVVNWNTVDLLDDCLTSIERATPSGWRNELVVVDNASSDGSVEHLRRHWPHVRVIANTDNVGFCRANNQAIAATDAPLLLLVNTDARLPDGGVEALTRHLADPRVAVVAPRLVYGDGTWQRWTAGRLPSLPSMATYLSGVDRLAPSRFGRSGLYLADDTREPFRPEWVSSAVMLVRRSAADEVGAFDDDIFVYMDDVDLCERLGARGWQVVYAADTTATHFMGASTKRVTGRASPEALRSLNRWYVRQHGVAAGQRLRALEAAGFAARAGVHAAASLTGRPGPRARLRATTTHLRLALEGFDA